MVTRAFGYGVTRSLPAMLQQATAAPAPPGRARASHAEGVQSPVALALEPHAMQRVERPQGRTITCESGTLWPTFSGDPCDVVLEAGESHRCANAELLLIQALQGSRMQVH